MTIRLPIGIVLLLALGQAGCDSHSSVLSTAPTPSPVVPTPVQSVPQEIWILTGTYAGHTGPAACIPGRVENCAVTHRPLLGCIEGFSPCVPV